jgi:hypothetical protein
MRQSLKYFYQCLNQSNQHNNKILTGFCYYETDFGVSYAKGVRNTKIGFLKARRWWAFKKLIFIMRIAGFLIDYFQPSKNGILAKAKTQRDANYSEIHS